MFRTALPLTVGTVMLMVLCSPQAQANAVARSLQSFSARREAIGLTLVSGDEETEQDAELREKEAAAEAAANAHREICYPGSWPVTNGPVPKDSKLELCQTGGTGPWNVLITLPDGARITAPDGEYTAKSYAGTIIVFAGETCTTTAPCGVTPPQSHLYSIYPATRSR